MQLINNKINLTKNERHHLWSDVNDNTDMVDILTIDPDGAAVGGHSAQAAEHAEHVDKAAGLLVEHYRANGDRGAVSYLKDLQRTAWILVAGAKGVEEMNANHQTA